MMTEIFDSIPVITVMLFTLGLIGVMIYERSQSLGAKESIL
jgi:hypothetical protein